MKSGYSRRRQRRQLRRRSSFTPSCVNGAGRATGQSRQKEFPGLGIEVDIQHQNPGRASGAKVDLGLAGTPLHTFTLKYNSPARRLSMAGSLDGKTLAGFFLCRGISAISCSIGAMTGGADLRSRAPISAAPRTTKSSAARVLGRGGRRQPSVRIGAHISFNLDPDA
jgi:hypothetical protein